MAKIYDLFTGRLLADIPIQTDVIDIGDDFGYQGVKILLKTRFGDDLPKHFEKAMSKPQSQPYMYGDVHNVKYRARTTNFNRPYPVPCEVTAASCTKVNGILVLGANCEVGLDEPFPWMDSKYKVTLNFLKSLPDNTRLHIKTRSDLIARDDYLAELSRLNVTINILYSNKDDAINRVNEPGAPSYKRRLEAITKLKDHGDITANLYHHVIPSTQDVA